MKKTSYPMVVLEHFYYYCQSFVTTLHTQISKLMLRCNCMQKIKKKLTYRFEAFRYSCTSDVQAAVYIAKLCMYHSVSLFAKGDTS